MIRILVLLAFLPTVASAAPPPGIDLTSDLHRWFDHQFSIHGTWCCDVSDGHMLEDQEWQAAGDAYMVRIAGVWFPIPQSAMRDPNGGQNPTGHAVIWYTTPRDGGPPTIYCFAPGTFY